ncbi:MAG TPA: hypothetical protein EYP98_04145 [Planctomycetes bacterium]|nr:hypothetical protein [Planctomycetota bacterium]
MLGKGMPAVAVADLVIQERELDLIAATHGRGIYRLNLAPLHWLLGEGQLQAPALAKTPIAYRPKKDDTVPVARRSFEERVPITFYLTQAAAMTLAVRDQKGAFAPNGSAVRGGGNTTADWYHFRWDLVTKRGSSMSPYFVSQVRFLSKGVYELRLTGSGIELVGSLTVATRN